MKTALSTLTTGFALFSMFFGSGNLVFPIASGVAYPDHAFEAALGMISTGVLVPFLGVYAMVLYQGNTSRFFGCLASRAPFWICLLSLSLMGPFGVLARCLTVAHGSFELLLPSANLPATSFVLCSIIYLLALNKTRLIQVLGSLLTPLLLLSIATLVYWGLDRSLLRLELSHLGAFQSGFVQGYQTMDLLAAFFFSKFVIEQSEQLRNPLEGRRLLVYASWLGGALLAFVYLLLVALGARYSEQLQSFAPEEMLGQVALLTLGEWAVPLLCTTVVLACLTTALVLSSLFATFLENEVCQQRLCHRYALLITLLIGFSVSTLDFAGIAAFLGPILETLYPALILLTAVNIAHARWGWPLYRWPVIGTLFFNLLLPFCRS